MRKFNKIFKKNMSNNKSYKKAGLNPFSRKYVFGKTTNDRGQVDLPPSPVFLGLKTCWGILIIANEFLWGADVKILLRVPGLYLLALYKDLDEVILWQWVRRIPFYRKRKQIMRVNIEWHELKYLLVTKDRRHFFWSHWHVPDVCLFVSIFCKNLVFDRKKDEKEIN